MTDTNQKHIIVAIVVNWNKFDDTVRCIDSLKRVSPPCNIVVVDNGSTGEDVRLLSTIPDIVVLQCYENLGFGRGNNVGINWALKNTECSYILLLNNDATLAGGAVSILKQKMDKDMEIGMAVPRIVLTEMPDVLWYGGGDFYWPKAAPRTPGYLERESACSALALTERTVTFATGCAVLIRRSVLETVGGFDRRYFMYDEDGELSLRVIKAGWTIRYVPQALVYHDSQGSQREKGSPLFPFLHPDNPNLSFNMYYLARNRLLTARLHARGWGLLQFIAVFPLFLCQKLVKFAVHRKWGAIAATFRGIKDFLLKPGGSLDGSFDFFRRIQ